MVDVKYWIILCFFISTCLHVSHLTSISVGLLLQPAPLCELCEDGAMALVDDWQVNRNPGRPTDFNITISIYNEKEPLHMRNQITSLLCDPTVALLSTIPCSATMTLALKGSHVPLLLTNHVVTCQLDPNPNIIPLPAWFPLDEVFRHVISNLHWQTVNVFYDTSADQAIKTSLLSAFEDNCASVEQYFLQENTIKSTVYHYLLQSQRYEMERSTNNVLFCRQDCVMEILDQANHLNMKQGELHGFLLTSRWLVITMKEDMHYIHQHLGDIDNLAVLNIGSLTKTPLENRVKDALSLLEMSLSSWISQWSSAVTDAGQCPTRESMQDLTNHIHTHIENKSLPLRSCAGYGLHTAMWVKHPLNATASKSLVEQPLCLADNATYRLNPVLKVLPNAQAGFNLRRLSVGTNMVAPFMSTRDVNGSLEYYGLCLDVLDELASVLNFTYDLIQPADGQWGVDMGNGTWTGLVGMLQRQEVDLVIAPLTITRERMEVMDFSSPFYTEESSVLLRLPDQNSLKWRVVIEPFRWPVWACIFLSVPLAGAIACYITRLTSKALQGTAAWASDIFEDLERATWYVFGALLTQGGVYEPQTSPGRAVIGLWWCYSIVLVAAYGGNLIAFLTVSKVEMPFNSLDGMLAQSSYKWGTLGGSVYVSSLQASSQGNLHDIWHKIKLFAQDDPEVLSPNFEAHLAKAKAGQYGFISSRTTLLDGRASDCDLALIWERFLPSAYAVGLQLGSQYKRPFSAVLDSLRSSGMVDYWQQRHWPRDKGCRGLVVPAAKPVTILDTQSAFYVLCGGVALALVTFLVEKARHHRKRQAKVAALRTRPQTDS